MSDLIDRQAVIEAIERDAYRHTYLDQILDIIKSMPSVQPEIRYYGQFEIKDPILISEQRWILCSERLPEAQTEVIVSCTDDSGDTKFRYTSSGWVTTNKEYWIVDNEINNFVVAWKEMPEPYKGEQGKYILYYQSSRH